MRTRLSFKGKLKTKMSPRSTSSPEPDLHAAFRMGDVQARRHTHTDFSVAVVSDRASWLNGFIPKLIAEFLGRGLGVRWMHTPADLLEETIVFYLGCGQLVPGEVLARHRHNLVVHESDLPKGRGWSPLSWQILEGRNEVPITLFEAWESVDSGPVYLQKTMSFTGHELVDELRAQQGALTLQLCLEFVDRYPEPVQVAREQEGEPTFYPKRGPQDSELDPDKTIREQFNLLRVVDNERYPAWFELEGQRYVVKVEKQ